MLRCALVNNSRNTMFPPRKPTKKAQAPADTSYCLEARALAIRQTRCPKGIDSTAGQQQQKQFVSNVRLTNTVTATALFCAAFGKMNTKS
jgi:hypothetical protein